MSRAGASLAARFCAHLTDSGLVRDGDGVVVALSGGLDSTVLLHLLRFTVGLPHLRLEAAHLDHAMRGESADDARWVRGLTKAWDISLSSERAAAAPTSEDAARVARYDFLERVRVTGDARWVVTAHHADDVVETVLFRMARGTGIRGLRGIPETRAPAVWRPLLPFHRQELVEYAAARGISWREDASNAGVDFARNAIRHRVLPALEEGVSPRTRAAVLRLARLARQDEDAWESLLPGLMSELGQEPRQGGISILRDPLVTLHPAVRARVLRALVRQVGGQLDATGTAVGVEFTSSGASGGSVQLTGGITLRRSLDRLDIVTQEDGPGIDTPLSLAEPRGEGEVIVGGRRCRVAWGPQAEDGTWSAAFDRDALAEPLTVRGWRPGDRIRLAYGTKKLKKLFLEARLPREERARTAVVVDARGTVLWIPGLVRAEVAPPGPSEHVLNVSVTHV